MSRRHEKFELTGEEEQLVSFKLGKETFGIKVSQVREIGKVEDITKVPNMPEFIEGMMNLRGQITTVINLKKRFNIDSQSNDLASASRIIIAEIGDNQIGIMVDAVEDVLRVPRQSIVPPPKTLSFDLGSAYLMGICKLKDKLIMLLDIDRMIDINGLKEEVDRAGTPVSA